MKKILIIIPCYNEAKSIKETVREVSFFINGLTNALYEILVVNDGSTDTSLDQIKQSKVSYLDLAVNLGIGGAMQAGFKYAKAHNFDIAIQLDGDGQHNATEIPKLTSPILNGQANVVIGSRFILKQGFQSSKLRRVGIKYFSKLISLLTQCRILDVTSGFRAFDRQALAMVSDYYPETYPEPEILVLFHYNKLQLLEVPVIMNSRDAGVSSIGGLKSLFYIFKVTFGIVFSFFRLNFCKHD